MDYFAHLRKIALMLEGMAKQQRAGVPYTAEQMAFINEAVTVQVGGCGPPMTNGWYPKLVFVPSKALEYDPTIADVHTAPGLPGGQVLHVGTGAPRLMVTTVDTCNGPRAYAGLVSSYYEKITTQYKRLDDQQWKDVLYNDPPVEVPWMSGLVVNE